MTIARAVGNFTELGKGLFDEPNRAGRWDDVVLLFVMARCIFKSSILTANYSYFINKLT